MTRLAGFDLAIGDGESKRLAIAVVAALGVHFAFSALQFRRPELAPSQVLPWQLVEVEASPEPPPAPVSEPAHAEEALPSKQIAPVHAFSPRVASAAPPSDTASGAGQAEEDSDAAAVEATEFSDSDWAMASGTGTTLGGGRTTSRFGGGGVARGGTLLAARDLSREALPPDLSPLVERNFPQIARMYRVEGRVIVSALLDENGVPSDVRVDSVTPEGKGFGEACARTVHQGPKWRPKLNRDGRPVATSVTYTCSFRLPKDISHTESAEGASQRVWTHSVE
jgi:outer membrane biosynthesis protein TonB